MFVQNIAPNPTNSSQALAAMQLNPSNQYFAVKNFQLVINLDKELLSKLTKENKEQIKKQLETLINSKLKQQKSS